MNTSINDNRTNVFGNARPLTKLNNKENKSIQVSNNSTKVKATPTLKLTTSSALNSQVVPSPKFVSKGVKKVMPSGVNKEISTKSTKLGFSVTKQSRGLTDKELSGPQAETKFITKLMRKGKKEKAEMTLLKALKRVEQELLKKETVTLSTPGAIATGSTLSASSSLVDTPNVSTAKTKKQPLPTALPVMSKKDTITSREVTASLGSKNSQVSLSKLLERIIENAKPLVRLKKVRIAGTTHQKPVALTKKQAESDAIKRIITNAKARSEKSATLRLAKEFEEIYLNIMSNKTLTEVRELHKLAEINKANITLK